MMPSLPSGEPVKTNAAKPRKRFVGSKSSKPSKPGVQPTVTNQMPQDILQDAQLNAAIKQLPSNYSFEIHKTIHHVRKSNATMVALQMPEGLQMFACTIADIVERFTNALTVILGDVTYGACCIDDYTAVALGCDMLVHYGHSCLVPMDQTSIKTLYVFVEIGIDSAHLAKTIRMNFPDDREIFHRNLLDNEETRAQIPIGSQIGVSRSLRLEHSSCSTGEPNEEPSVSTSSSPTRLALVSTIQFVAALQRLKEDLTIESPDSLSSSQATKMIEGVPSVKEEISTSEKCPGYLGDGRFHLESIMIANPSVPAFRYDPYSKKLTRERYDHIEMQSVRDSAVQSAQRSLSLLSGRESDPSDEVPPWGVILGTLGRQGNFKQLQAITHQLEACNTPIPYIQILLSELSPAKLALFNPHISAFIQTSCPRLSTDWGYAFDKPLLSPYEAAVAVGKAPSWMDKSRQGKEKPRQVGTYPMDFYAAGTPWAISRAKATFEQ
ncbi:hypothetical protein NLJ89_g8697 [Agrocybe chaxingu]|uniref:2-(3-amino-3-carboxypropyl)histidine synthase subunit 1 n=1 Tax=Agrocybe chaxingu TaxID=84603 RepID=A0A9W8K1C6_9AGAR|nr:hypothetical protein NLJ89_g8697 [Agrocybe chaxingu]